jgi:hypothetical protein
MPRPLKYSDAQMIEALLATRGMVYLAAARIGCEADTIYLRAKRSPRVKEAMRRERGKVIDLAEQKLFDAISAGEPWAIQLALKTLGKDRGYVERQELAGGVRLELVEEIVEAPIALPYRPSLHGEEG